MLTDQVFLDPVNNKTTLKNDALILDLETASFRRRADGIRSALLIRAEGGRIAETRFVIERKEDEYDLLLSVSKACREASQIITFNGTSFDLPLLRKRLALFGLPDPLIGKELRDLYLLLKPLDRFFDLADRKLASYTSILSAAAEAEDDAQRCYHVLDLLPLSDFFRGSYTIHACQKSKDAFCFSLRLETPYPLLLSHRDQEFLLTLDGRNATLCAALHQGMLKRYYTDHQNYEYLVREGYAVHKNVASIVAKSRKTPATRENCYTFYTPDDNFLTSPDLQRQYVDSVLHYLSH